MPQKSETAKREEDVLVLWKHKDIFQKSVEKDAPKGEFVFYDGPPFATGLPHYGSLLSSIIKDVVPRYKTMRGYRVHRRWGWDCHGLPIENLVEKQLNLKTKKDIEKIGIAVFNEAARASVLQFEHEWEKYIDRVGRFVDFKHSYKTMDNSYIESVWWALKELYKKDLLYEGHKVLMYCPHDETPLAKAEIAADNTYRNITEEAVTVKFHLKPNQKFGDYITKDSAYILAWTTTPWTLPGNVALAVNKETLYTALRIRSVQELYIVANELVERNFKDKEIEIVHDDIKGSDLIGLAYEPLFDVSALKSEKSFRIYGTDFVNTNEGTGVVHTAVMYGEDDFALGQKEGLPQVQILDTGAHYNHEAPEFIRGQYIKKAEKAIKEDLENRGLLFGREMHTHSYPHCWRCGTPLIYNAVASWFINIQKIKERMLAENEKVRWVPEYLKEGRFKNNVEQAPDWTISRNRFWASPLPIWKEKKGHKLIIVGSLQELKSRVKKSGNRYFVIRHGEAEHMIRGIYSTDPNDEFPLTKKGEAQVVETAQHIPRGQPLVIISSPALRSRQSAEIITRELGLSKESIITDERLHEMNFGIFDGKPKTEYQSYLERPDWYSVRPEGGENFEDAKVRFGKALYDYESKYQNSTLIIVSHAIAVESLMAVCLGTREDGVARFARGIVVSPAEMNELSFVPLPLNGKFELDLHRPYTDSLVLLDEEGREYERIPEVIDCWVESAGMPFAELHYPFENEDRFVKRFPSDFIAEYIAQTRTWFYYMHALGTALFDSHAFRTVVTTGTILSSDGSKMSKSKGNYMDPLELLDLYGADALRLYLMGSVVMQAEDLRFRDEDVREQHNRFIGILWNSYKFFDLYRSEYDSSVRSEESQHPLDRWVRSRLGEAIREVTESMEQYDTTRAVRSLRQLVEDYSTWYVRRSRDRVRGSDAEDKALCLVTQRDVLLTLSKLLAPLAPFIAESIYQGLQGEKESVHLEHWPEALGVDETILTDMASARVVVSQVLELRDRAGIKVRQPLGLLEVKRLSENEQIRTIIAEEVNVKNIVHNPELQEEVWLDTKLTPELKEEGVLRDMVRAIQDARKKKGLSMADRPVLRLKTNAEGALFVQKFEKEISAQTGLRTLHIEEGTAEEIPGIYFPLGLEIEY